MAHKITPERVVAAYQKTGLKPVRNEWYSPASGCACGLGVLLVEEMGAEATYCSDEIGGIADDRFGASYASGFVSGFDGCRHNPEHHERFSQEYDQGYEDGKAAWEAAAKLIVAEH